MTNKAAGRRVAFIGLTDRDRDVLSRSLQMIAPIVEKAVTCLHQHVRQDRVASTFFENEAGYQRAVRAQTQHWKTILSGRFDEEYEASVRRIADVHARIGLEPSIYMGGYSRLLQGVIAQVEKIYRHPIKRWKTPSGVRRDELIQAFTKAVFLDMDLSISFYFELLEAERQQALDRTGEAFSSIAAGDLTQQLSGLPRGFEPLEAGFNETATTLRSVIDAFAQSAGSVRTGAREIAAASEDLARRTEGTAAQLEQTSATLGEIEQRVRNTAENARQTAGGAGEATAAVKDGIAVAGNAVAAMHRVSESASGIDEVIEGVDKIAFQTRILAMNAAVEAGRAGAAGRGFAVVADLVSSLAYRAEEEARKARTGLTATQGDIDTAVAAVASVESALGRISTQVGDVGDLVQRMANDNAAQVDAIAGIASAIANMDLVTQQNAAMVEQASAAAVSLDSEAGNLTQQVSRFQL